MWSRTNTIIHFRCRGGKCKERAFIPDKNENEQFYLRATHSRRCKCQLHVEKRPWRGESTNLDASTIIPTIPWERLTRSKMTPRRQTRAETANGGYKGLESRLVDEGDKKFIRRSVGAAASLASRTEKNEDEVKWGRRGEDQSSNTSQRGSRAENDGTGRERTWK